MLDTIQTVVNHEELLERAERIGRLGHWHVDLETNKIFWSKEVYRIHGETPQYFQVTLEDAIDFYHPDDRSLVKKNLDSAIKNKEDFTFESRIVKRNGEIVYVRSSGEFSVNDNGDVVSIFGIFQDITEQVMAVKMMEERNAFQDIIMNTIPDLLFVKDKEFRIIEANEAFLELYPEECRDKVIGYTTLEEYNPTESDIFLKQDKIAFAEGYSEAEETITFPDGKVRILFTKKVRFTKEDGEEYILGLSRDITELKETEGALREANFELEEFSYRTSHDLRSPLVSSIALLNVARESVKNNDLDNAQECIKHIENSLEKLSHLVKDILHLTHAKKFEESDVEVNIDEVVTEALSKFSHMDNFPKLKIEKNINILHTPCVKQTRLKLIVENMLSNSVKYQDLNDNAYIKISAYQENSNFIFEVEDNGIGIPADQHNNLFKMFRRFHSKVSFGSGLGLYMMKKSAEVIGGDITFQQPEKGAVFRLVVPVR